MAFTYPSITTRLESDALEPIDIRRLHFYEKGAMIPLKPGGAWQVYLGIVQLSEPLLNGDEVLLGWLQTSGFLGFGLTLTQQEIYQAKALSDVYLRWYALKEIQDSSKLSNLVLTQTLRRLQQTEALLAIAGLKRVDERLVSLLKLLTQEMGESCEDGIRLSARLTHQMLANAIGTTRVTVTRLLGELQSKKLISFDDDRHLIIYPN